MNFLSSERTFAQAWSRFRRIGRLGACFAAGALMLVIVGGARPELVNLGGLSVAAQSRSAPRPGNYDIAFKEFRLRNGLRVLLAEDHTAPTYSITMTYNVGSRDEKPGRTGFAHLFEHMLFQGSENVGKGEHFILVQNNGGSANGTTNADRTNYFETLPANQLEMGIFFEADRMPAPMITPA